MQSRNTFSTHRALLAPTATLWACSLLLLGACNDDDARNRTFTYDFDANMENWEALFADYPAASADAGQAVIDQFYELQGRHAHLPEPLDSAEGAVELKGSNHSDDLQMFVKRELSGLRPNTDYRLELVATIATDAPSGCMGVGGAPGESVWIKAAAATSEPKRVKEGSADEPSETYWRLNLDVGEQSNDGTDGRVLDDFANSQDCEDTEFEYELKTVSTMDGEPLEARTDARGTLWVLFGTDSGFEGVTRLFIDSIVITAQRIDD